MVARVLGQIRVDILLFPSPISLATSFYGSCCRRFIILSYDMIPLPLIKESSKFNIIGYFFAIITKDIDGSFLFKLVFLFLDN